MEALEKTDTTLTKTEAFQLESCERQIKDGLANFIEVGKALVFIRDHRLYRASHATFDAYCKERWDMGANYAHRLQAAATVMGNLLPIGNKPKTESQIRPLTRLPKAKQRVAWKAAVKTAKREHRAVRAKDVAQAAARVQPLKRTRITAKNLGDFYGGKMNGDEDARSIGQVCYDAYTGKGADWKSLDKGERTKWTRAADAVQNH